MAAMRVKRARKILLETYTEQKKPLVREVIEAVRVLGKDRGCKNDIFSLGLFLHHDKRLTLKEKIEIGNHFSSPDVWDDIIMAGPFQMHDSYPLEVGLLKEVLEGATHKDVILEAITKRLNSLVKNQHRSSGESRSSYVCGMPLHY